jgi:hypothetical protein
MGVAGSGVTQPEAALEVRELLAGYRCRRLSTGWMRERPRDWGQLVRRCAALDDSRGDAAVLSIYGRPTIASMTQRPAAAA